MSKPIEEQERFQIARRAWLAYESLPRMDGKLPSERDLERQYRLSGGHLSRLFKGERGSRRDSMLKVATALNTSIDWIYYGLGRPPIPTGPLTTPPCDRKPHSGEHLRVIPELEEEIDKIGRKTLRSEVIARVRMAAANIGSYDRKHLRDLILYTRGVVERQANGEIDVRLFQPPPLPPKTKRSKPI